VGAVNLKEGATSLGSATLDGNGEAQIAVNSLSAGSHSITAEYPGTSSYAASSAIISQDVLPAPDFSLSVNPPALLVKRGQNGAVTLTITPTNRFNETVTLTCSGLPAGAHCTITPGMVTTAGGPATATLMISVPNTMSRRSGYFPWAGTAGLAAFCSLGIGLRRRRPWLAALLLIGVIGAITLLTACGGRSYVAPASSVMNVTGTSGSLQHSASVTVTIQ
jgi:hypothetical protein